MYDHNNIFAKIVRKEVPCDIVYEDDNVISIRDINPLAAVHVLVLTKGAYTDFHDFFSHASMCELGGYFAGVNATLDVLGLKKTGYRLIMNTGRDANQEVMHLHTHILGGQNLGLPKKLN